MTKPSTDTTNALHNGATPKNNPTEIPPKATCASKNLQLTDLYAEYYYKAAIKQTVDEKIGVEPNRDLLRTY